MTDLLLLEEMTELTLEEEAEYLDEYYSPYDLEDVLDEEELVSFPNDEELAYFIERIENTPAKADAEWVL